MKFVPADLPARTAPAPAPRRPGLLGALRRLGAAVWWPSPVTMRRIALAGVIAIASSVVTGAAVRLSQSGLGCTTWPQCTGSSLVAASSAHSTLVHAWVEFGNRLFVAMVEIVSVIVMVAAWRFRPPGVPGAGGAADGADLAGWPPGVRWPPARRRLVWLAAMQPIGVAVQAVLGGIVVLTSLNPVAVSVHFLATMVILAAAVALHAKFAGRPMPRDLRIRPELRWLSAALLAVTGLMLAAGTVVTGTGPLAGAASVPRYRLPLEGVTQFHADIGWLLGGFTVAMVVGLRFADAPRDSVRFGWLLLGLIGVQGAIGYAQYFSGLPAGLVWVHEIGSAVIWIITLRLFFSLRVRVPLAAVEAAASPPEPGAVAAGQAARQPAAGQVAAEQVAAGQQTRPA
jgi:heme a synthase